MDKICARCHGLYILRYDEKYYDEHHTRLCFLRCVNCSNTVWIRPALEKYSKLSIRIQIPAFEVWKGYEPRMGGWYNSVQFNNTKRGVLS